MPRADTIYCPKCGGRGSTKRGGSSRFKHGVRRRRRECLVCDHRWTSVEISLEEYNSLVGGVDARGQAATERAERAELALKYERSARMTDIRAALTELTRVPRDVQAQMVAARLHARGELLRDLVRL